MSPEVTRKRVSALRGDLQAIESLSTERLARLTGAKEPENASAISTTAYFKAYIGGVAFAGYGTVFKWAAHNEHGIKAVAWIDLDEYFKDDELITSERRGPHRLLTAQFPYENAAQQSDVPEGTWLAVLDELAAQHEAETY